MIEDKWIPIEEAPTDWPHTCDILYITGTRHNGRDLPDGVPMRAAGSVFCREDQVWKAPFMPSYEWEPVNKEYSEGQMTFYRTAKFWRPAMFDGQPVVFG